MQKTALVPIPKINFKRIKNRLHIDKKPDIKSAIYCAMSLAMSCAQVMGNLTPFGTAFFASVCTAKNLIPTLTGVAAGSLIAHPSALAMCYVITAAALAFVNILWDKPLKTSLKASLAGSLLFFAKTVASVKGGLLVYDMLLNFAEAFLCAIGVIAADKAMPVIFSARRRTVLSAEEAVGVVGVFAAALLAFNNIPPIFGIKIGNIMGITVILMLNMHANVPTGAVVGIVAGAVNCIGTYNAGSVIGAYAFSSLISALFQRYGKTGVTLGFIFANAVITVFLNGSTEVLINVYEILIASVLMLAIPKKFIDTVAHISGISTSSAYSDNDKVRTIYNDRLTKIAESLNILSRNFPAKSSDEIMKKEIGALVNRTGERTCADCSLRYCCWQKKGTETKKAILQLLSAAQNHGKAYINDVLPEFKNRCIRTENLLRSFNDSFEMYRTNLLWQKRLADSKSLACVQMGSIAKILDDMANEKQSIADNMTRSRIRTALDGQGFTPQSITAYFKGDGNMIIELKFAPEKYREDMKYAIAPCLTAALGVKIRFNEIHRDLNHILLSYSMCERFCRATGAASIKKHGENVCGDSFTSLNLTNGTYVAAISDGMGSGEAAASESKNTIDLLKNFLRCGFDVMHAIRLINSSLMLTGTEEIFSTIDLCSINMHTGIADFIKIGGASTYIKTGNSVEKLTASSLPAGIIEEIKPKHFSKKLENDTLIVMVSDGVEGASTDDKWLEKRLKTMDTVNPHVIADKVLELAVYQSGGKAKDDMTVIATRIWEENNV
ncbi:MAG: stage II sporulation protein E [Clostridia bacterium]|nr:stage II sporulation protein E [Clostridia bacterium]